MSHQIHWMEKKTQELLTLSTRKNLPKQGSSISLIAKKQKLKVKILSVEPGGYSYFDDYYVVDVEII